ncbi:hypothetical protein [Nocardia sp. NPDC047038]|uniref:hypothetical protein n=1 Tax=Nocardia sp. NPDC047038 TaxID=3154338 RepID=UPI00340CE8A6
MNFGVGGLKSIPFTRRDKPVINGIEIMGSMVIRNRDTLTGRGERYPSGDQLPDPTAARLTSVVRAVADHLLTDERLGELHHRAAVLDACTLREIVGERLAEDQRTLREITAAVTTRCDYYRALAEHYDNIANRTAPPGPFAGTDSAGRPLAQPTPPQMYVV